ncbi:hypothetical protein HUJ05_010420 [Dendroctonus ponderosae]|nr:hypothetical protein HUJ05_010420 [Dendroctonus ponderosae]
MSSLQTFPSGIASDSLPLETSHLPISSISAKIFTRETHKYLVSTVRFSRGGVVHNFGVPPLSKLELELVERSALQIKEREQMALDYLKYIEAQTGKSELPLFAKREKLDHELLKQKVIR